jgi:hypothetical protein
VHRAIDPMECVPGCKHRDRHSICDRDQRLRRQRQRHAYRSDLGGTGAFDGPLASHIDAKTRCDGHAASVRDRDPTAGGGCVRHRAILNLRHR